MQFKNLIMIFVIIKILLMRMLISIFNVKISLEILDTETLGQYLQSYNNKLLTIRFLLLICNCNYIGYSRNLKLDFIALEIVLGWRSE